MNRDRARSGRTLAIAAALALACACNREPAGAPAGATPEPPARPAATEGGAPQLSEIAAASWRQMLAEGAVEEARLVCEALVEDRERLTRVQAHACLANVALQDCPTGHPAACSPQALAHLDQAIGEAPEDQSLHLGRLRVLLDSGRAAELSDALAKSLASHPGHEVGPWLSYVPELKRRGRWIECLAFLRVLQRSHPDDPEVLKELGSVLLRVGRIEQARPVLRQAIESAPDDPVATWNLGELETADGRHEDADRLFREAIELVADPATKRAWSCQHAGWLELRGELDLACRLQRQHCPAGARSACR